MNPHFRIKVNGAWNDDLTFDVLRWSCVGPMSAELSAKTIRHDVGTLKNNDHIEVWDVADAENEIRRFDGWIRADAPQGIAQEGICYTAYDIRHRLDNEIIAKINGSVQYVWNPDGKGDVSAPGYGWRNYWTIGEVLIDLLEHAFGLPEAVSAIPEHHRGYGGTITETYLTSDEIGSYDPEAILAIDEELDEFEINATPFGQALTGLLEKIGGVGWYIEAHTKELKIVTISTSETCTILAGEVGQHVDAKNYRLADDKINISLDGVYTKIILQGRNKVLEARPSNMQVSGVPQDAIYPGDLPLVKAWDPLAETGWSYEAWANKEYDGDDFREWVWRRWMTDPQGPNVWRDGTIHTSLPLLPSGVLFYKIIGGEATKFRVRTGNLGSYLIYPDSGCVLFLEPLPAQYRQTTELYAWYMYEAPFIVSVGPGGAAYTQYGIMSEYARYDGQWGHPTSDWPESEGEYGEGGEYQDSTGRMTALANELLGYYGQPKRSGELTVDEMSIEDYAFRRLKFQYLGFQWPVTYPFFIYEIELDPAAGTMRLMIANRPDALTVDAMKRYQLKQRIRERNEGAKTYQRLVRDLAAQAAARYVGPNE